MQEIQEGQIYIGGKWFYRLVGGKIEYHNEGLGWVLAESEGGMERLVSGSLRLSTLTGEDVCPPKKERPYDMTAGQVFDALEADWSLKFENKHGTVAYCSDKGAEKVRDINMVIADFGNYGRHADGWRKVVADE